MFSHVPKRRLVLGGPGCGKTTRLLDIIEERIEQGLHPSRIAFVSFTTKAAKEAIERAAKRFNLRPNDFPHFRTVHSMAYHGAQITPNMVMQRSDYIELGRQLGVRFSSRGDLAEGAGGAGSEGDKMLSLIDYSRATQQELKAAWLDADTDIEWFALHRFAQGLQAYKDGAGKIDFNDMLWIYAESGEALDVDLAIIDEAQDLSSLQWHATQQAFQEAPEIIIAGDDDQAIHTWNGADIRSFLSFDAEVDELPISYRLPEQIHAVADQIGGQIKDRLPKHWESAKHDGSVNWLPSVEAIDPREGDWFFLARNKVFLAPIEEAVRSMGYPYRTAYGSSITPDHLTAIRAWEHLRKEKGPITAADADAMLGAIQGKTPSLHAEMYERQELEAEVGRLPWALPWYEALKAIHIARREYYRACLRRGESLDRPRIYIGTIHSVKGGEADHVVLGLDMTQRTYAHYQRNPDDEHRVFYVGATRARQDLYLLPPQGEFGYEL